jgi:hypothetical protein
MKLLAVKYLKKRYQWEPQRHLNVRVLLDVVWIYISKQSFLKPTESANAQRQNRA